MMFQMSDQQRIEVAQQLIQEQQYEAARALLIPMNDPQAQRLLAELDEMAPPRKSRNRVGMGRSVGISRNLKLLIFGVFTALVLAGTLSLRLTAFTVPESLPQPSPRPTISSEVSGIVYTTFRRIRFDTTCRVTAYRDQMMYPSPGEQHQPFDTPLPAGFMARPLFSNGAGWYMVQSTDNRTGWILADAITISGLCDSLPVLAYPSDTVPDECSLVNNNHKRLQLYDRPLVSAKVVEMLSPQPGNYLGIRQRTADDWYQLTSLLWFNGTGLTFVGDCESIPVMAG